MTDEAKALVEREGMQVLLPPASIDGDYLMGWLEGQSYLIANYGTDEAFDQAIAVANKVHKLQDLIETQAREIERLRLDVEAQEALQVSAYHAGLRSDWNFGVSDDNAGMQAAMTDTAHIKELRRIREARAALAGDSHDQ